ncbi:MAG: hypothetical protein KKA07_03750 [Bacteroidetes bacterium]|nr:hypothetical protein [Bacteroidota bacterium]MBU1718168.1 hypothetical protein [Bacteroidota bacterium]
MGRISVASIRITLILLLITLGYCYGQVQPLASDSIPVKDSLIAGDSLVINDTIALNDSPISTDTIAQDSIAAGVLISPDAIKSKIVYAATDSIRMDMGAKKVFMFSGADVSYEKINLKAAYIEISFDSSIVYARGEPDSTGKLKGNPVFAEGDQSFDAKTMRYNYETKKGIIKEIFTQEGDGYMHGETVKKLPDDVILIHNGAYTTCNEKCPHFQIRFGKAKVIPDDKIITGPAFLEIEHIPTPLAVPFGYFPNKKGQASGILIPQYGEEERRGFFLNEGGYYFGINDYVDLALRASIYSKGSYGIKTSSNYRKRYKYSGLVNINFANNRSGDPKIISEYESQKDFFVNWKHTQDPKARPRSNFSANVNAGTSTYNKNNSYNPNAFLQNTLTSSVSYSTSFGSAFNFSVNMNHNQNNATHVVNISLPEMALTSSRFYPFKRKVAKGKQSWYEKITVSYAMNTRNYINTYDSLLFREESLSEFRNGIKHTVPVSTNFNLLKYFNLTPTISYNERWYFSQYNRTWDADSMRVLTDTLGGFGMARDFGANAALRTTLYGIFRFKRGPVSAIRHKVVPNVTFSWTPDFSKPEFGFYQHVQNDTLGNTQKYYRFDQSVYGAPPSDKSGRISFSLSNNLEMKVRTPKDSVNETKKVVVIEKFDIGTYYDLALDSLNWSKIYMNGYTRLFKNLNITYASLWDPYIISPTDSTHRINENKFEWDVNNRLLRWDRTQWNFSLNWTLRSDTKKKQSSKGTAEELETINSKPDGYVDFNIPWNLTIGYNLNYTKDRLQKYALTTNPNDLIQTVRLNGELKITDKWKVTADVNYDFVKRKFSTAVIDIYRDLHCWEMSFHWIPFGSWKSYLLTLNVKSSVLQDLKLTKRKDWRDY